MTGDKEDGDELARALAISMQDTDAPTEFEVPTRVLGMILTPDGKAKVPILTSKPTLQIGRDNTSDVKLHDKRCSLHHCEIHITQ